MSERLPNLIVVSGPSGAGKSTAMSRALIESDGLRFSVSHTTRPKRSGEAEGVDYYFVARERFEQMRAEGQFLETAEVHGNLYGTSRSEYERAQADGVDLLLDLDVQGAGHVRGLFPEAVTIFILPPSHDALWRRLRARGQDDEKTLQRRLGSATSELNVYHNYDYVVVNDDLEECVDALKSIIRAARYRRSRMEPEAQRVLGTFRPAKEN